MSVALSSLRARVLSKLHSLDGRNGLDLVYVDQELRDQYIALQARVPGSYAYSASAGTITAGAVSFTLPTTSSREYEGDFRIQLTSDNRFLEKVTQEEMQRLRHGTSSSQQSRSSYFSPYQDSSQQVTCWCFPINAATETYNLFYTPSASDIDTTGIEATTLVLNRVAQDALVFKTAAAILAAMDPDEAKSRRLNPAAAALWMKQGNDMTYKAAVIQSDIESGGRVMRLRS